MYTLYVPMVEDELMKISDESELHIVPCVSDPDFFIFICLFNWLSVFDYDLKLNFVQMCL